MERLLKPKKRKAMGFDIEDILNRIADADRREKVRYMYESLSAILDKEYQTMLDYIMFYMSDLPDHIRIDTQNIGQGLLQFEKIYDEPQDAARFIASKLIDQEKKADPDFEEWQKHLLSLPEDQQKEVMIDRVKHWLNDSDKIGVDHLRDILEEHPNDNTDISFLMKEMKKLHPDITPEKIIGYFCMLNMCGIASLGDNWNNLK